MDTHRNDLPAELQLLDVFVHQSRLNNDIADVLHRMKSALDAADTDLDELREDIAEIAVEQGRQAARMESLTATVASLMQRLDPLPTPPELHSVKAQPESWYPAFCSVCGHNWHAPDNRGACPECSAEGIDVAFGPLTRYAE